MKTNSILERLIGLSNNIFCRYKPVLQSKQDFALIDQITRSSSSAALNYSEAIVSASDKDYANKVRISLKEMNETCATLRLLESRINDDIGCIDDLKRESDELVSILSACCRKAEAKSRKK